MTHRHTTVALAALLTTAAAGYAVPKIAAACGSYQLTEEVRAALEADRKERARLTKLRATRAKQCVLGSMTKITAEQRARLVGLPDDAKEHHTVWIHYPRFSKDDYRLSLYADQLVLNRLGYPWNQINVDGNENEPANLVLRPAGGGEWMVVEDFAAECPKPKRPLGTLL